MKLLPRETPLPTTGRFRYELTETASDRPALFFKYAVTTESKIQLARESRALNVARRIGIPTPGFPVPYHETADGRGALGLERLDPNVGTILASSTHIADADPAYGRAAARALAAVSGRAIPPGLDTAFLVRDDRGYRSPESFRAHWSEQAGAVLDPRHDPVRDHWIPRDRLIGRIEAASAAVETFLNVVRSAQEHLLHGDAAPNNLYFAHAPHPRESPVLLFDWEHAGATRYPLLARITDLGNFYGRCWPNPALQREFLAALFRDAAPDTVHESWVLAHTVALFGTLSLARFAMRPDHPEHPMAVALLTHLEANLSSVDNEYRGTRSSRNRPPPGSDDERA